MRDKLASEVDRYVDFAKRKEVVEVITHPDLYSHKKMGELAKLASDTRVNSIAPTKAKKSRS